MTLFPENESARGATNMSWENIAGLPDAKQINIGLEQKDLGAPSMDLDDQGNLDPEGPNSKNIGC